MNVQALFFPRDEPAAPPRALTLTPPTGTAADWLLAPSVAPGQGESLALALLQRAGGRLRPVAATMAGGEERSWTELSSAPQGALWPQLRRDASGRPYALWGEGPAAELRLAVGQTLEAVSDE